ncbi:hypothetical protein QBC32DRAFT_69641 [Pseudoneurospora amorphoporcata]|uniref:Uncharacterized protein n=1 Tax=Pseudoneurospora amorphoporcata TaxID=241081 RepID=A0AAN6NQE6_9PEZI|nr:hypothetical protein QBC32DRAFT_69641 [Pseudoneurospora amorphoporcata]
MTAGGDYSRYPWCNVTGGDGDADSRCACDVAVLCCVLCCAVLCCAVLCCAVLCCAGAVLLRESLLHDLMCGSGGICCLPLVPLMLRRRSRLAR